MSIFKRVATPDYYATISRVITGDLKRVAANCRQKALRETEHSLSWTDKVVASGHGDSLDMSAPWEEFKAAYFAATEKLITEIAQAMLFNPESELELRVAFPDGGNYAAHQWLLRAHIKPVPPEDFVFVEPAPVAQKPPIKFDFPADKPILNNDDDFLVTL